MREFTLSDDFDNNALEETTAPDKEAIVKMMANDILSGNRIRELTRHERNVYGNAAVNATGKIPAFTSVFALLRPFVDATAETCYVDEHGRVGLSYWFLYAIPRAQRVTWLTHEAMHVLNSHFERGRAAGIPNGKVNEPGDLEINTTLSTMRWTNLDKLLVPENYGFPKYKTMEQYYSLLQELKEKNDSGKETDDKEDSLKDGIPEEIQGSQGSDGQENQSQSNGSQENGDSTENGSGGQSQSQHIQDAVNQINDMLERLSKDIDNKEKSASGSGQDDSDDNHSCDESNESRSSEADNAGIERNSKSTQEIARQDTKERIKSELAGGRGRSNSSSLFQFYETVLNFMQPAKVDWRDVLRRTLASLGNEIEMGKQEKSYRRVNRRYSDHKVGSIIFPGSVNIKPTVMAAIDNSGSMGTDDFVAGLIEINDLIEKSLKIRNGMQMFTVDTHVHDVQLIKKVKDLNLVGGGGTDMSLAFNYVSNLPAKKQPDIFILITDGELYSNWNEVADELKKKTKYTPIILVTREDAQIPDNMHSLAKIIRIPLDK